MFMTSFPPSLVRAGITGIILLMSKFLHRRADTWESLGIAMFCILTYNPFLISNVGLLLSFAGTIGIIVFNNTLNKYVNYKMDKIYRKLVRKNKKYLNMIFIATKTKTFKVVKEAIILTISATLAVSPIVLVYFNKLSITSLLISVISSFLVGPIVVLGLIFIIVKINIIQILLEFLLRLLIILANCGSKLPLNQVYLITPNVLQILLYYCFIFSLFYILKINMERKKIAFQIRIKNLISLFKYKVKVKKRKVYISFVLICFIYFIVLIFPKNLRIYFVDVGQGDCSLIVTPLNKTILIDGGGSDKENYNVRRKCFNAISPR